MTFFPLFALLAPAMVAPANITFFVGTYTSPRGSKGIYRVTLRTANGGLSKPVLAAEASNPSYIAFRPGGSFLYAVHEEDHGSVSAYRVGPDHSLEALNTQAVPGSAPCYLSADPLGLNLLVASYVGGMVSCLPINASGALEMPSTSLQNSGTGPNKERQEASHMHWIQSDSKARFVYSCDLGTDKVQVYRFVPGRGLIAQTGKEDAVVPAGSGPRHGVFNSDNSILYVTNEMGNSVTAFHVDAESGALTPFQTLPTLTEGEVASAGKLVTTAEIAFHPSGKWVYVSNRGHDSITLFKVLADGHLERETVTKLVVKMPRGFGIDPSGKWLVVGGQESDDLASYSIDLGTGELKEHAHLHGIGKPVCILFDLR
jgi:6-phosphogluconolactonase